MTTDSLERKRGARPQRRNSRTLAAETRMQGDDGPSRVPPPRVRALHPLLIGPLPAWDAVFAETAALGFDTVLLPPVFAPDSTGDLFRTADHDRAHPILAATEDGDATIAGLCAGAREHGLALWLDLVADRAPEAGVLVRTHPDWFEVPGTTAPLDPRRDLPGAGMRRARTEAAEPLAAWWAERLVRWRAAGVSGLRCLDPQAVPATFWRALFAADVPPARLAWTPGVPAPAVATLAGLGFTRTADSLAWWDLRAEWWAEEAQCLAAIAPALAVVGAPFAAEPALPQGEAGAIAARRRLRIAAGFGCGLIVPMGWERGFTRRWDAVRDRPGDLDPEGPGAPAGWDVATDLRAANETIADGHATRSLAGPGAQLVALMRADGADTRTARSLRVTLANTSDVAATSVDPALLLPGLGGRFTKAVPVLPAHGTALAPGQPIALGPGEARVFRAVPTEPVRAPDAAVTGPVPEGTTWPASAAARLPRIGIEAVLPAVDGGRFAVKRLAGELLEVEADLICDGHDRLAAVVQYRAADEAEWREAPLALVANDRWRGAFPLARLGRHVFRIVAWRDVFASFRVELEKKHDAGLNLTLELQEGSGLVSAAAARGGDALAAVAQRLASTDDAERLSLLLDPHTESLMRMADDRPFAAMSVEHPVDAERREARFASWYELFPRSQSGDPARHGTFADVIRRLPEIRDLGFDVLYFTPIHPIGRINRKGRNNSLTAGPDDPGSPYAIGAAEGGHDAIHPELGTIEDFRALVAAAHDHGLEIALDFAIQCSPDHPWLKEHKDWFAWRPDGSLRYAENPPKKYEDIVNVEFYATGAVPSLWEALRDVVRFWAREGVRTFRVDNPHTKPLPFWEWLIADIRAEFPDAIFFSEAFTRPKMMYRLAKVGFGQSYTYFTWRNEKREIMEYLTELTTTAPRDFFRPNFFVNTPDINPRFLQTSGRPGFLIRAALATTLSGLWGMYEGFELCEAAALPGKEEYFDSEKYQLRAWDRDRPGNIKAEIARLNAIRRANPALQSHLGLAFHNAYDDAVLWFRKATPDRSNVVLVAVSLDPHHAHEVSVELPLWEWGLPDHAALEAEELMTGRRFVWQGKMQQIRLDPAGLPFGLWRVHPVGHAA
ncbi:maltotransferase domain-containing protein [Elioraea sp.]|uniref:alpha-1,4-glucan--maltose-1-phosphate maltosyltransferase n=1 Tax=Elioraea sp. TaxID=2185103 RepID=UPI003F709B11